MGSVEEEEAPLIEQGLISQVWSSWSSLCFPSLPVFFYFMVLLKYFLGTYIVYSYPVFYNFARLSVITVLSELLNICDSVKKKKSLSAKPYGWWWFRCLFVCFSFFIFLNQEPKLYAEDGSVDLHGNPPLKAKTGNWKACPFILGYLKNLKPLFVFISIVCSRLILLLSL